MSNKKQNKLSDLSPHLFWDYDINSLSADKSEHVIIERVLDYGLINDWKWLLSYYGKQKIIDTALQLNNLSLLSAIFLSTIFEIEKEKFACYKNKRSAHNYLNY
ncbi:MAG: hypothetical protein IPM51_11435 [Sphingobacteriaceae bacterium]|nr:hypothetical protein [Sphingobacteriaceae bacterium]